MRPSKPTSAGRGITASRAAGARRGSASHRRPPPRGEEIEPSSSEASLASSRRSLGLLTIIIVGLEGRRAEAFPLAPLGDKESLEGKQRGLRVEDVRSVLEGGLKNGQYFVNSKGMPVEVFDDDCRFVDPTNDVVGLSRYLKALDLLFDRDTSSVELLDIQVKGPKRIEADYRLQGRIRFPWNPCVSPYTGRVVYELNDSNLVVKQSQTWSITAAQALKETFTPCSAKA